MGEIVDFRPTQKSIYRAAVREMEQMYRLSSGGADPIVDDASREMFERGEIDEVKWISWERYCIKVLNNIGE
ncbi:MAG: hypothetical protein HY790_05195 [Deltaproteobacteria bacterium]|nr:hypothetical protein [Deltaproteobacteria bacterium]MBI4795224.1 hypothetical protein [Deltaproteobacteria bacterium]